MDVNSVESILSLINARLVSFEMFMQGVVAGFTKDKQLNACPPIVHSIKFRIKYEDHVRDKILRKNNGPEPITRENVFRRITDIAGVRVLHLYQRDFPHIHAFVEDKIRCGDWVLHEKPKAYTWDPESQKFFEQLGLEVEIKESFYTSIHYVIRPRPDSDVACEIQVRTLFEEIWGEIDHQINYPITSSNIACCEQIRVLARLVGAGSRLADAIHRTHRET